MAKNQPPPNGCISAVASAKAFGNERFPLANLNRNRSHKLGQKEDLVKELEATLWVLNA
jgi:hypothetical protein